MSLTAAPVPVPIPSDTTGLIAGPTVNVVIPGELSVVTYVKISNESPLAINLGNLGNGTDWLDPYTEDAFALPNGLNGFVQATPYNILGISSQNAPASFLLVTWYGTGEQPSGSFPVALTRLTNVGNKVVTTGSANPLDPNIAAPFVLSGLGVIRGQDYATTLENVFGANLLRYYRLGETSGVWAQDISGKNQSGTLQGAPTQGVAGLLTGDTTTCYTFAAASHQYIACPPTGMPTGNQAFTYCAWFKFAANPGSAMVIAGFGDAPSKGGCSMWIDTAGKLNCDVNLGTGQITSGSAASPNTPHLACVTWDGTTLRLYLDGASVGSSTPGGLSLSAVTCTIASNSGNSGSYTGQIQEAAFGNSALTPTQVLALYTAVTTYTFGVNLAAGVAYLLVSGALEALTYGAMIFATVLPSVTYYVDLNPDGTVNFSTTHSAQANYLTVGSILTDGAGHAVHVTDLRPTVVTLFPSSIGVVAGKENATPLQTSLSNTNLATMPSSATPLVNIQVSQAGVYLFIIDLLVSATAHGGFAPSAAAYGYHNGAAPVKNAAAEASSTAGLWTATISWTYLITCAAGDTLELWFSGNGTTPVVIGQATAVFVHS